MPNERITYIVMFKTIILSYSIFFACSDSSAYIDLPMKVDIIADIPIVTPLVKTNYSPQINVDKIAGPIYPDEKIMYVWTDDEQIIPILNHAVDQLISLGINVAFDQERGVQFTQTKKNIGGQARAYYNNWCYYDTCNASNAYVKIHVDSLGKELKWQYNMIEHELAHIVSGWGACVKKSNDSRVKNLPIAIGDAMHLTTGHLISNGNAPHYADIDWSNEDIIFLHSCLI